MDAFFALKKWAIIGFLGQKDPSPTRNIMITLLMCVYMYASGIMGDFV